jgi:hypothetical protein
MPIDTPYNREIARQYNASNRKRANYLHVHLSPMSGNELIVPPHSNPAHGNGYNMHMMGSGVGVYKKAPCCSGCAGGKAKCEDSDSGSDSESDYEGVSGGNNAGLNPKTRMEMNLGAGKKRELKRNTNAGLYAYGASGGMLGFKDLYNKGKDIYETGKRVVHKVKRAVKKGKESYEHLKKAYHSGEDAYNELKGQGKHRRRGGNARAVIVKDVMAKQGLNMIQASKYVKEHNLY